MTVGPAHDMRSSNSGLKVRGRRRLTRFRTVTLGPGFTTQCREDKDDELFIKVSRVRENSGVGEAS
jgi:hypothetical protein